MFSKFRRIMQTICGIVIAVTLTAVIAGCVNPGTVTTFGENAEKDIKSDTKKEDIKKVADTEDKFNIFDRKNSAATSGEKEKDLDTKSDAQRENRHTEPRITKRPKETPTFEKMADGTIWYNNENSNYTFKFPGWMNKELTANGHIEFSGNPLGVVELPKEKTFSTDNFTMTVNFIPAPEGTTEEIEAWLANLTKNFDDTMSYNGWDFPVDAIADSGGPFARRALAPINDNGALEVILSYYSTPEIKNTAFLKKTKDAFGMIIYSATELYLSD